MAEFYRISNPDDVRDLAAQIIDWQQSGNPKAAEWVERPPAPSVDAVWQGGEWITPEAPPVVVTMRSLQFALASAGLYAVVKTAACSTVEGEIWWTTSPTVARNHAFVAQLAAALGQSDAQIDAIFATAQASAL